MSAELIDRVLEAVHVGETTDWEFKSARGGFPGSFWETYSAMANAEGGMIALGVRETDTGAVLDGLTEDQVVRYQKTLWDGLNNRGQVNVNLLESQHVEVIEIAGVCLLAIRIPRATRTQRPVHLGGNPFGSTYRRRHEGDYRCADAEVRRMLADADPDQADHRILVGFGIEDLDAASLAQYRQRLRAAKGEHPWVVLADRDLLERLGGWRRDRTAGTEGVTLAGLLMFGKDQAIRDPEAVPRYFVDYREKLDPAIRWTDRILPDGTWEANLFQFYQRVWPKLAAGLPTPFRLEGVERRDVTPAHEALREAFVNALIHADYSGAGGVVIERHADRFLIENPGTLLVSLEQYLRGGVSECRNPSLQQMFFMIGGGERAGSGADRIRSGWRAQHWRTPRTEIRDQPDRVALILPMVSLIPDTTLQRLRALFGGAVSQLSNAELQAVATAEIEGVVSNARLQELLSDHSVDITRMLVRLCDQGLLVSDNRRRWTTYRLGGPSPAPRGTSFFPDGPSQSPESSGHLPESSGHLPDEILTQLRKLAGPVTNRGKVGGEEMASVITALCRGRFLTAEQLAGILGRSAEGLRKRFLTPMTREGKLRLRYPQAPNQPNQAYTAAEAA